jgi:hypothetical protein
VADARRLTIGARELDQLLGAWDCAVPLS